MRDQSVAVAAQGHLLTLANDSFRVFCGLQSLLGENDHVL